MGSNRREAIIGITSAVVASLIPGGLVDAQIESDNPWPNSQFAKLTQSLFPDAILKEVVGDSELTISRGNKPFNIRCRTDAKGDVTQLWGPALGQPQDLINAQQINLFMQQLFPLLTHPGTEIMHSRGLEKLKDPEGREYLSTSKQIRVGEEIFLFEARLYDNQKLSIFNIERLPLKNS